MGAQLKMWCVMKIFTTAITRHTWNIMFSSSFCEEVLRYKTKKKTARDPRRAKLSGKGFHVKTDHTREERNRFGTITKCCLFLCSFCYMQLWSVKTQSLLVQICFFFLLVPSMLHIYIHIWIWRENEIYLTIIKVKLACNKLPLIS